MSKSLIYAVAGTLLVLAIINRVEMLAPVSGLVKKITG